MENSDLSITLTVSEWNVVMNAIGQRPFVEVVNIINKMKKQADSQIALTAENKPVNG